LEAADRVGPLAGHGLGQAFDLVGAAGLLKIGAFGLGRQLTSGSVIHRRVTGCRMASARANNSGSIFRPDAAQFSSSCSGRLAPTIADATLDSRNIHASANCAMVTSAC